MTKSTSQSKTQASDTAEPEFTVERTPPVPEFPIVGIGCSAGGLEALEKFFVNVPKGINMAFVVVQHLAPQHDSNLPDLIGRVAHLPVKEIKTRTKVKPGAIYVIPPNKELTITHDTLYLVDPVPQQGLRLPIDFFLRTLAEDRLDRAVGVILSGMGSDGMLGLRAIKEKGGLTLAQDPRDAKSESMPRSAIDAGLVDIIAPSAELPARMNTFLSRSFHLSADEQAVRPATLSALDKIILLLRERSGANFSEYKTSTLYRRIERRMALYQLHGIADYVRYLRDNPQELDLLFRELLIGVTNFFRDPGVWDT
ncbi:MAG: chemotaxis protein CheB, partial [Methylomonas sp.]